MATSNFLMLLAAYGITFALMQGKLPALNGFLFGLRVRVQEGKNLFERMFECAFCTGFHAGWVVCWTAGGCPLSGAVVFAFGAAAFCYICDLLTLALEGRDEV